MFFLAKELNKTVSEIMEMSTLEFRMWAVFYRMEEKRQKGAMNGRHQHYRPANR